MTDIIHAVRMRIAETGRLLFERHLTDAAGGNISVRAGDFICMSPRFSGNQYHWQLQPDDVLVVDQDGNKLEGPGDISREAKVHFRLLKDFPDGSAVIHAHPRNVMVFAMAKQPIYPVLEGTVKFGVVKVARFVPAHTSDLADTIAAEMAGQESVIRKQAAAVIAPWHGLFVLGKDLDAAFDAVERIDTNAYCILNGRSLPTMADRSMESISQELMNDLSPYKK